MTKFVEIFLLAILANLAIFSSAINIERDCKGTSIETPIRRLHKFLECGMTSRERPSDGKNATNVGVMLIPTLSHFDEESSNLELHSLLYVDWYDPRLKWDPTQYDNITEMPVTPWRIWTPELSHRGAGTADRWADTYEFQQCFVRSKKGYVSCMIGTVYNIRCETDFTTWPYDRQRCTLLLASWTHTDQEVTIKKDRWQSVTAEIYEPEMGWELYVVNVSRQQASSRIYENENTRAISIEFVLDRTAGCFRGQVVSPAIVIMVMTMVTMYLDPQSIERFAIGCSNIIVHLLSLLTLGWYLPHNGSTIPNILLFYCDSMVLAIIALLLTFVLGRVEKSQSCPSKWMTSFIVRILKNKFGQAFMLSVFEIGDPRPAAEVEAAADDTSALVDSDSNSRKLVWRYVSIFFLRVSYYVCVFTYFIMFIALILVSSSKPPVVALDI